MNDNLLCYYLIFQIIVTYGHITFKSYFAFSLIEEFFQHIWIKINITFICIRKFMNYDLVN